MSQLREATDLTIDALFLQTSAYGSSGGLATRQAIYEYQQPRVDFVEWSIRLLQLRGDETVLDVGCGNCRYLSMLQQSFRHKGVLVGADLAYGMLSETAGGFARDNHSLQLINADVQRLPVRSGIADVVFAMQMLHHVPDIDAALAEIRRIVRAGGRLVVGANGDDHLGELDELMDYVAEGVPGGFPKRVHRFGLTTADKPLRRVFRNIEQIDLVGQLVINRPEPVLAYIASMGRLRRTVEEAGADWGLALSRARMRIESAIAETGAFVARTHVGILVCS